MSVKNNWLEQIPQWVWWSFLPVFGGLAITYAGYKSKTSSWKYWGLALCGLGFVLASTRIALIVWLLQVGTSFAIRKKYLVKVAPKTASIDTREVAELLAEERGQIDINNCSQDDLVYKLNLPIVYANDIKSLLDEGYMFTSIEELGDLIGIPENSLKKIEPLITFGYYFEKELDVSWRRLNRFSLEELVACDLDITVAKKIIAEREKAGSFKSLIDVKKRTGLPFNSYKSIV